ncbi:hypothetical protein GGS20DRAFT_190615 [Poronia punctata]|nr:hypothetical protein GGS20DRAFT_190615 [Poronia punctata]
MNETDKKKEKKKTYTTLPSSHPLNMSSPPTRSEEASLLIAPPFMMSTTSRHSTTTKKNLLNKPGLLLLVFLMTLDTRGILIKRHVSFFRVVVDSVRHFFHSFSFSFGSKLSSERLVSSSLVSTKKEKDNFPLSLSLSLSLYEILISFLHRKKGIIHRIIPAGTLCYAN